MRILFTALVLSLLPGAAALASETAFVNVNVVPLDDERVLRERTVLVRDGVIAEIGTVAETVVPPSATIVDGTDRYLMPGLAEMHGHVPPAGSAELQRVLTLFAVNGVTTVRGMLGGPSHLALRRSLEQQQILGPRLYTSGPSFNGNSVSSPARAAAMVRDQASAGYDFLKIHPGLSRAEFRAMATAADEAGIRFAGHVPADVGLPMALELGLSTIDHLDGYMEQLLPADDDPSGGYGGFFGLWLAPWVDHEGIDALAKATHDAGSWVVPTQTLFEHRVNATDPREISNWPEMRYMPAATVRQWVENKQRLLRDDAYDVATAERAIRIRRDLIQALNRHGAGLLLGSDAPQVFNVPGFSLHRELALMVDAGLTPFEALRSGTVNAARWLGWEARLGEVRPGMEADLLLLDDNPLVDITNTQRIHGVMLRGKWFDRQQLNDLLQRYGD